MKPKNHAPSVNLFSNLSNRTQHLIAVSILFLLPVILFDATVTGGKKIVGSDIVQWRAGAESVLEYEETHEREALWVQNMFSGMPAYVVSYSKAFFHIDNIIRKSFASIFPAGHYWVLLFGCYLFFILQGVRPFSAVLGAVFIGLTTYIPIILGAGHNSKFITYAYIPWLMSGYWLLTKNKDNQLWGLFTFTMALTLVLRGSHPQVTYYFLYLLAFWWMFDTYTAFKNGEQKAWIRINGFLLLGGFLALVSNIQPYWSIYEYSPFTIRGGSAMAGDTGLSLDYAFRWSQGLGEMLTLILPNAYGGSSGLAYWGAKPGTSGPHYFGAVAFILFLIGLVFSKKRRKYVFLGTGILAMLFSLGHHFEDFNQLMYNFVPYFDKFRAPETWLILTIFCFTTIAVYGIDELIDQVQSRAKPEARKLYTLCGVVLGLGFLFSFATTSVLSFENAQQRQRIAEQVARQNNLSVQNRQVQQYTSQLINQRLKPERIELAQNDAFRFLLIAGAVIGLILFFYRGTIGSGVLLAGLILISSFDMISVGKRYINDSAIVDESIDAERRIRAQITEADQYLVNHVSENTAYPYRVFPLDFNPFNNAIPAYFYPSIGGYTGAKLSHYQDLIEQLLYTDNGLNFNTLNMLNVKYITASRSLPFEPLKQVYSGDNVRVYENTTVLPKAFFVDSLITVSTPRESMSVLKDHSLDLAHTAVVETQSPLQIKADSNATAKVASYNVRKIKLETQTTNPGFLVLSEIYYPKGWKAFIDGRQTPIYKTNYVLRGIEVPAGEHEILFHFNPASHVWGTRIAWAGNIIQIGLGVFLLGGYLRQRFKTDSDES